MACIQMSDKATPWATCPHDGEPLVSTFEVAFKEFLCMACGRRYGFFGPKPSFEDHQPRYNELLALFDAGVRPRGAEVANS